jgi:hypothetical protein
MGGVDWIGVSQDCDKWRALVNVVVNLLVPRYARKLWSDCTLPASRKALSSTELLSLYI